MAKAKNIVNWEEHLAAQAKDAAAVERPDVGYVSLRGGMMTYMEELVPGNQFAGIVLSNVVEQAWYSGAYDPDNISNPNCYALGFSGDSIGPPDTVPNKQSDRCADCEKFQWGSAIRADGTRSRGKACGTRRRLCWLPADALESSNPAKAGLATMKVPVTSVKNFSKYVNTVAAQHQRPVWSVGTIATLKPDAKTQVKLTFECTGPVPEEHLGLLQGLTETANTILLQGYTYDEEEPVEESTKY